MDKNLAGALLQAQSGMGKLVYDSNNPHFKSKYASLTAVLDTVRGPLSDAGLVLYQSASAGDGVVMVRTMLIHAASGESIEEMLPLPVAQQTPQAYGSAITYGRRYLAMAMCGLAPDDDDGNESSQKPVQRTQPQQTANRAAQHRNAPQRTSVPPTPPPLTDDIPFMEDSEAVGWDDLVAEADANRAADKKAATPFVWSTDADTLDLCTGMYNSPDCPPRVLDLSNYIAERSVNSNAMSDKQYQFLVSLVDKRYGGGHNAVLSACCQHVVSGENKPGFGAKELIDWLKEPEANAGKVAVLDSLVEFLKADIAQFEVALGR